jgi:hypothetical protein
MDKIRAELQETFPYRYICVDEAEADDVIAVLTENCFATHGPTLILSSDGDFAQLQRFQNVKQYDPIRKKWIKEKNPEHFLKEHILEGDRSDGVPNVRSADDCLVLGRRQTTLRSSFKAAWIATEGGNASAEELRNYARNRELIDLSFVPQTIKLNILDAFSKEANKPKKNLFNYFVKHRLNNLIESIQEF